MFIDGSELVKTVESKISSQLSRSPIFVINGSSQPSEEVIIRDDLPLWVLLQFLVSCRIIVVDVAASTLVTTSTFFVASSATSIATTATEPGATSRHLWVT